MTQSDIDAAKKILEGYGHHLVRDNEGNIREVALNPAAAIIAGAHKEEREAAKELIVRLEERMNRERVNRFQECLCHWCEDDREAIAAYREATEEQP